MPVVEAAVSTVLWLPSHPTAAAASMDRHWRELERQRREVGEPAGWRLVSPLGEAPPETRRGGRWERAWHKYVGYPLAAGRAARAKGVRVVHVLDHSFAHLLAGVPDRGIFKVATVHDLAPLQDAADLTPAQVARFRRTVENLHRADLVLADSRHSADEAIKLLALRPERVRVLPLGVDVERFQWRAGAAEVPPWDRAVQGCQVVLSVGVTTGRKNLASLPAVFRALRAAAPELPVTLLRAGHLLPEALRDELRTVLGEGGLVELGFVSEAELVAAYQRADALLFPSRLEGFGFPVLEGMAAGCPVVCTNVTSLPEVGGEAALYFHPDDPAGAAGHLRQLFTDEGFRRERVRLGREQAARFSWREHYRKLLDIYRQGA